VLYIRDVSFQPGSWVAQAIRSMGAQVSCNSSKSYELVNVRGGLQERGTSCDIVALDLDFDGCSDALTHDAMNRCQASERERLISFRNHAFNVLHSALANADRCVVMCGSNRQDYGTEAVNEWRNKNGFATRSLQQIQNELSRKGGSKVEIFKALRADGGRTPGTEWELIEHGKYNQSPQDIFENLRSPTRPDDWAPLYTVAPRTELKTDLLAWQVDKLQEHFGSEKTIHLYFFDDRPDIIEALASVDPKPNVKITLVRMCYNEYIVNEIGSVEDTIHVLCPRQGFAQFAWSRLTHQAHTLVASACWFFNLLTRILLRA